MSADPTSTLNPAQLEAVHHLHGPCLVVAGAGSGKTRVITTKIARLLQAGYQAKNIAAITFTNKAAQEMRERAKGLVGARAAKDLAISTFHSLGVRLLREEGTRVGLKEQFSILDSDDVLGVLRDAGGTTDANMAKQWQWTISLWKNMGLNAEMALKAAKDEQERVAAVVMGRYQERLAAYQAVDFDDLISLPLKLLTEDAEARGKWQDTLRYVLVDEYQDTNSVQYELLKAIVGERGMFTAVGDDDQSIYGWRGATIENLKRLPVDYPNLKIIPLEQNYRSTGAILRAANNVIETNPKLFQKKLWSEYGDGEPIALVEADGEEHEAERAVARIQAIRASLGAKVKFADFAILYRANHQARIFEQALRRAEIPYKVSGGQSFFDKSEIKDLCAWLRLLVNQDDDPAFLRAVTTPKRGIGHTTLGALSQFAGKWKISMYEALFSDSLSTVLNKKAIGSLHEFGRYLNDLEYRARHTEGAEDAKTLMLEWLKDIGYEQHLYDNDENEKAAAARWSNVLDFVDWVAKRCGGQLAQDGGATFEEPKQTVLQVAQTISVILSLSERGEEQDQVVLTTLHASKGLEWPHVFLAGVNEGLLPFKADDEEMTAQRLEEERRLMYVGITRARTTLAVSTLRRRKKAREMVMGIPSRFIAEMRLHESGIKEDPREKLKRMREELAAKAAAAAAAAKQNER
ncbi:UvrD-helicase domain-containing protein [Mitsuaria sp. WAJ17]|uniref:UvrD-helicase domain-containing protein n=1 Tax=Mitsuaria sp. WAJ17 TaxID=2761452 RepID=UPI001602EE22|nr:UvrD-helicase domain-containing protein [Mitsuaria sp. WAJ17]MBB2487105.1 UvrD-helicase domain-containing protein [Mitsuaria sp. WAJ17]